MRRMQKDVNPRDVTTGRRFVIAAALLTIADAVMKYVAIRSFPNEELAAPVFGLALHKNPGIAFDIPIPMWIIAPLTVVLMFALLRLATKTHESAPRVSASAVLMFLGASNNFADRVINGFTTDYLILFQTSAINISDVLIILGAIGLLSYTQSNPSARTH